jgi:hypothetical protein
MDAYFIILCPGTNRQVRKVQEQIPFMDYPFISTDGGANGLVQALKVRISDQEFMPAILEVSEGTLSVDSIYIGRGPGQYFHHTLLKRLVEERCKQEFKGILYLKDARELINQLKRRSLKCQQGNLVTTSLSYSNEPPPPPPPSQRITQIEKRFDDLPPELLETILSYIDIPLLVKASRTSRTFYIAVCHVLMMRLRAQMAWLSLALPQVDSTVCTERDLADESLDRPQVAYRDLCKRVNDTNHLIIETTQFTRHWSLRRMRSSKHNMSLIN